MKTRIFKTVFPVLAFMLAVAGAFAFSSVPETNAAELGQHVGYYKVNNFCTSSGVMCQNDTNTGACKFGGQNLFVRLSDTSCASPLWIIE